MNELQEILLKINSIHSICHRVVFFDNQTRDYRPGQRRRAILLLDQQILPQLRETLNEINALIHRIQNGETLISSFSIRLEHVPITCQSFDFNSLVGRIREMLGMPQLTDEERRIPPHPNENYREALERINRYRLND